MKFSRWLLLLILLSAACGVDSAERNNAGISLQEQGAYNDALKAYQAAQVTSPDLAVPYFNASVVLAQIGDLSEARAALEQALKTADEALAAAAYYNLGNAYYEMERYDEAIQAYQQALLRQPKDENARYNLELALNKIVPTPTTIAPEPEFAQTPTSESQSDQAFTPTPIAQETAPNPENPSLADGSEAALSQEEAGRLLDSIQQDQPVLDNPEQPAQDTPPEKDW